VYDPPVSDKPPKSPTTKVLLSVGVIICVVAGMGIALLGVNLLTRTDTVAGGQGSGSGGDGSNPFADKPASPHKVITGVCEPVKTVKTVPPLTRVDGTEPKDNGTFATARCDSSSEDVEVRANVDYNVYYDTAIGKGVKAARDHYDSAVKVYAKKEGYEEVSGVGDKAFAVPLTDDIWQVELVDDNLTMTIAADAGDAKDVDLGLAKQVAEAYFTATKR
jgi:hypothetical protein